MLQCEEWGISLNIKNKINSINFKTLSYLIIFSISILLALWFFQIIFLNISYERYQIKNINKISKKILKEDYNVIDKLDDIAYEYSVCIEYVSNINDNASFNTKNPGCIFNSNDNKISKYKYKLINSSKNICTVKLINPTNDARGLLSSIKVSNGIIFVYTDLEDVGTTTEVLKNQLIYITLIAILIASIIATYLSRRLTDPIVEITKKAKMLGVNKNITFYKNGIKEIDDLAETLNYAQKELSKTDELRRDLMANVSHDLKTPLTMIKAYSEMVRDISYKDDVKRNGHLNIIISETDRLNTLINDILLLSKAEANVEELNIESFNLVDEINTIINRYEIIKETEHYNIIYSGPKKAIIKGDKKRIDQVIYNLINNAINYTGKDKTVKVKVESNKDKYVVKIIDSGKGIKKEDIKYIWNRYYKNEKNHKRNVVGTGLGLSIVKSILEEHNFNYGVESKIDKGTTFYFEIDKDK